MASTQHRYNYTTLDKLSSGLQRVNVYGVVSFIVPLTFGGLLVEIKVGCFVLILLRYVMYSSAWLREKHCT